MVTHAQSHAKVLKDTADIREKLLRIWDKVDRKEMSTSEARLHIGLARAILDTLKVEIAAAHLARSRIPAVPISTAAHVALEPPERQQ
jgi:hypothetical protein